MQAEVGTSWARNGSTKVRTCVEPEEKTEIAVVNGAERNGSPVPVNGARNGSVEPTTTVDVVSTDIPDDDRSSSPTSPEPAETVVESPVATAEPVPEPATNGSAVRPSNGSKVTKAEPVAAESAGSKGSTVAKAAPAEPAPANGSAVNGAKQAESKPKSMAAKPTAKATAKKSTGTTRTANRRTTKKA